MSSKVEFPEIEVRLRFHYDYLFIPEALLVVVLIFFWRCRSPWWRWFVQATLVPILMAIFSMLAWHRAWSVWKDTHRLTHFDHHDLGQHPPEFINKTWTEEVSLEHYPNLFCLVCFAPAAFVVNFGLTAVHLGDIVLKRYWTLPLEQSHTLVDAIDLHLHSGLLPQKMQKFDKLEHTFWIVSLPLVYGWFSFMAALDMWEVLADAPACVPNGSKLNETAWKIGFHDVQEAYADKFEARLGAGDAYEAVVLWLFGRLMMNCCQEQLRAQDQRRTGRSRAVTEDVLSESAERPPVRRAVSDSAEAIQLAGMPEGDSFTKCLAAHMVTESLLASLGLRYFIISCLLTCVWKQLIVSLRYFRVGELSGFSYEVVTRLIPAGGRAYIEVFLYGVGFACSFAAIEHVLVIEVHHHKVLEAKRNFGSFLKFASVKIMVSLVFMQGVLHTVLFRHWTDTRWKLFHASAFVVECFFLSIMHWFAWDTEEEWYNEAEAVSRQTTPAVPRVSDAERAHSAPS